MGHDGGGSCVAYCGLRRRRCHTGTCRCNSGPNLCAHYSPNHGARDGGTNSRGHGKTNSRAKTYGCTSANGRTDSYYGASHTHRHTEANPHGHHGARRQSARLGPANDSHVAPWVADHHVPHSE